MFECSSVLTIRVGNVAAIHPFIEQIDLSIDFGRELNHCAQMVLFHTQYQVGLAQHERRQLVRPMHSAVDAVFGKQLQGIRVHGPANERADSGAAETDVARLHALAKQVFHRRAAADIARADDQYTFEHNIEALLQSGSGSIMRKTWWNHASLHPCEKMYEYWLT